MRPDTFPRRRYVNDRISTLRIEQALNALPFVQWDRFVEAEVTADDAVVIVYGWIARPDGRHPDFIVLEFCTWHDLIGSTTSSAHYSARVVEILNGPEMRHESCQRVEDVFQRVHNIVPRTVARQWAIPAQQDTPS